MTCFSLQPSLPVDHQSCITLPASSVVTAPCLPVLCWLLVQAAPDWPKAQYRHACVLMELRQHDQALQLLQQLMQRMAPGTSEVRQRE